MAQLKNITVKGSMGLYYGMGVDEVEINFEELQGLVTLAGSNGHGKSTFLELLSPFPVFPSRQLKDPRRYNFKNQFRLRDSYKEVTYLHHGKEYRFRIEVPAGTKTKSPEGYIWEDDRPLVKGKITQYKKKVEELFGSEKLFYSSIFSCQGAKKLTDIPAGEFKALLIELLGLKKYDEYHTNVGKCMVEVQKSIDEVDRDLARHGDHQSRIDKLNAQAGEFQTSLFMENSRMEEAQAHINTLGLKDTDITDQIAKAVETEAVISGKAARREELESRLQNLLKEVAGLKTEYEGWVNRHNENLKPHRVLVSDSESIKSAAADLEKANAQEKEWNEQSRILADMRRDLSSKTDATREQIDRLEEKINLLLNDSEADRLKGERDRLKEKISANDDRISFQDRMLDANSYDSATKALETELLNFCQVEELLKKRPDHCRIDDCPFIKNALAGAEKKTAKGMEINQSKEAFLKKIQGIKDEKEGLEDQGRKLRAELNQVTADLTARETDIQKDLIDLAQEKTPLDETLSQLRDKLFDIDKEDRDISAHLTLIPARLETLKILADKKADLDAAVKVLEHAGQTFMEKKTAHESDLGKLRGDYRAVQDQVNKIQNGIFKLGLEKSSATLKQDLKEIRDKKAGWEAILENVRNGIADIEKKAAVCLESLKLANQQAAEVEQFKTRRAFLLEEHNKWAYLRDAVSKKGLQALEIAAAAPLMTSKANDLLHSAYGGEFFLDLVTRDPDTGAEILDIMVTRGDGQTFPLFTYSGGESVWILQAFKAAQILINAEKSGIHFSTCFADEETGALDKEKAERFIKMYRALIDQGNFEKLIFISHIPECQAMADHCLTFQDGGIISESQIKAA